MERIKVIFSFPRLYIDVYLFGRVFSLNFGNFKTDTEADEWKFGLILKVDKLSHYGTSGGFTSYNATAGFNAFTREFILLAGWTTYHD